MVYIKNKGILVTLLVILFFSPISVKKTTANFFPISIPSPSYLITSSGEIEPSVAPIKRVGSIYTLTSRNITRIICLYAIT